MSPVPTNVTIHDAPASGKSRLQDLYLKGGRELLDERVAGGVGGKRRRVVTKSSRRCEVQRKEQSQRHCNNCVRCQSGTRFTGVIA